MDEYLNIAKSLAQENNVWSAQQAQKQMEFQERMSSTAHQREVADLKKAGLNPVLSANSGAASATGAMGSTDTSVVGILPHLIDLAGNAVSASSTSASGLRSVSNTLDKVVNNDLILKKIGKTEKKSEYKSEQTLNKIREVAEDIKNDLPYKYKWIAGAVESVAEYADPALVDKFINNPLAYCLSILVPPGSTRDKVYNRLSEENEDMVSYFKNMVGDFKGFLRDETVPGILLTNSAKKKAVAAVSAVGDTLEKNLKSANSHYSSSGRSHGGSSGSFSKKNTVKTSVKGGSIKRMTK